MKYRHKPIEVDAVRKFEYGSLPPEQGGLIFSPGTWVVTGPDGRVEIVPDKAFHATYEPAEFRLVWPTEVRHVTQNYGKNPQWYPMFGQAGHEGVDLRAPMGSKIFAAADGEVTRVDIYRGDKKQQPYGNAVYIRHDEAYSTVYAHFSKVTVKVGDRVKAGDVIGLAGSTGNSSGPHLHFGVKKAGATERRETAHPRDYIDPTPLLGLP